MSNFDWGRNPPVTLRVPPPFRQGGLIMHQTLCLYPISARQRVLEQRNVWRHKGEYYKQCADYKHCTKAKCRESASSAAMLKEMGFQKKYSRCRNEKEGNIQPIGRFAHSPVVGIKKNGYQKKTCNGTAKLYTPKAFAGGEKSLLHQGKNEEREV